MTTKYECENCKTRFAEGFKRGQLAVKRKNKSGCCCIIDEDDNVVSACGAHLNWLDEQRQTLTELLKLHREELENERAGIDLKHCDRYIYLSILMGYIDAVLADV